MKVLFLADPCSIHDQKWVNAMAETHECFLISRHIHAECAKGELAASVTYLGSIPDFSLRNFQTTRKTAKKIAGLINMHSIDLVHILYAEPNALWGFFASGWSSRVLVTTRGSDVLLTIPRFFSSANPFKRLIGHLYRLSFRRVDGFTSTSESQAQAVREISARHETSVTIIRTGVDVESIRAVDSSALPTALTEKHYVLFPRLMRPVYHHELAIEAIARLPRKLSETYRFVFIDCDSPDKKYTSKIAALMDALSIDFIWLPRLSTEELHAAMKGADLVVMTPKSDGSSVTATECMLCKTPLILPPLNYDLELFGSVVVIASEYTAEAFVTAIEGVLCGRLKPDLNEAHDRVLTHANRQKEMSRLQALYTKLIEA